MQQVRGQPVQHIQPRGIQSNAAYSVPPFVSGGGIAPTSITTANVVQQHSDAASAQSVKPKVKSTRKPIQRRPRSKGQQKNLQPKSIHASSPAQPISHLQHTPQAVQLPPVLVPHGQNATHRPLQGQSTSRDLYLSPPQIMRQSAPLQLPQSQLPTSQSQQHDMQSRILQQQLNIRRQQVQGSALNVGAKPLAHSSLPLTGSQLHTRPQAAVNLAPGSEGHLNRQSTMQNPTFSNALQMNHTIQQRTPSGLIGKFDAAALQEVLSRQTDPKVYSVLRQQLEMLRGAGIPGPAGQRNADSRAQIAAQRQGQVQPQQAPNLLSAAQAQSLRVSHQQATTNAQATSQSALLHQQQMARNQQIYSQRQQQHQYGSGASGSEQTRGVSNTHLRTAPYHQPSTQQSPGVLNPHASQSMASLPQHVQHQLQAQIQARHIQAQLQAQSNLASQRNALLGASGGSQTGSQNASTVLPNRQVSPEVRKPRRSPKPSKPLAAPVQLNGATPNALASNHDMRLGASVHQTSAAQFGTQQHQAVSQVRAPRPSKRRESSRASGREGSVGSQSTGSPTTSLARRSIDSKKIEAERKRIAHDTELREISDQKKRRLQVSPSIDVQCVLSPEYLTPFSGQVNAWQRLLPFHVVLRPDEKDVSQEQWNAGVERLEDQYRVWFQRIKKNYRSLMEKEKESIYKDAEKDLVVVLDNDDGVTIETVILQDAYETVRKKAEIAQRKAAELDLQASRREAQQYAQKVAALRANAATAEHFAKAETERSRAALAVGGYDGNVPSNYITSSGVRGINATVASANLRTSAETSQGGHIMIPQRVHMGSNHLYTRSPSIPNSTPHALSGFPTRSPGTSIAGSHGGKSHGSAVDGAAQMLPHARPQSQGQLPGHLSLDNTIQAQGQSHTIARQNNRFGQHRPAPAMAMLGRGNSMVGSDRWARTNAGANVEPLVHVDRRPGSSALPAPPRIGSSQYGPGDSLIARSIPPGFNLIAPLANPSTAAPPRTEMSSMLAATGPSSNVDGTTGKARLYTARRNGPQDIGTTRTSGNVGAVGIRTSASALPSISSITQPLSHNSPKMSTQQTGRHQGTAQPVATQQAGTQQILAQNVRTQQATSGLRPLIDQPVPTSQMPKVTGLARSGSGSRSSRGSRSGSAKSQARLNPLGAPVGEKTVQPPQSATLLVAQTLAKPSPVDVQTKAIDKSNPAAEGGTNGEKERGGMGMGSLLNADGS